MNEKSNYFFYPYFPVIDYGKIIDLLCDEYYIWKVCITENVKQLNYGFRERWKNHTTHSVI